MATAGSGFVSNYQVQSQNTSGLNRRSWQPTALPASRLDFPSPSLPHLYHESDQRKPDYTPFAYPPQPNQHLEFHSQHSSSSVPYYQNQEQSSFLQTFQQQYPLYSHTSSQFSSVAHDIPHLSRSSIDLSSSHHTFFPPISGFQESHSRRNQRQQIAYYPHSDALQRSLDDSIPNSSNIHNRFVRSNSGGIGKGTQVDNSDVSTTQKKDLDPAMKKWKSSSNTPTAASQSSNNNSNEEDKDEKSPLPQNLRGDPFRSAKVKTELCRHFGTEKGCPFGDKCNYAHGEHELKYTKLMDLERAGLVDIEIFRTHPCPIWVATGACPFDQRCTGLHDPRIAGPTSWLAHAETLVNSIGSSVNVDKLYHQKLSSVYSCSPIYGFAPKFRWKSGSSRLMQSWRELYAFACNLDPSNESWDYNHNPISNIVNPSGYPLRASFLKESCRADLVSEFVRVLITLKLRLKELGRSFAYLPTHLFCNELCMVLQTRFFIVNRESNDTSLITEIEEDQRSLTNDTREIIVAREIAFGPVGDPGIRQMSIWFNIEPSDIIPCTNQQAKRHKRSRHRLKKDRRRERSGTDISAAASQGPMGSKLSQSSSGEDDASRKPESKEYSPFFNCQPIDRNAFDLITNILVHRSRVLQLWIADPPPQRYMAFVSALETYENKLLSSFESQRRHWMTWSWPLNQGRGKVDDSTDVPPVNGTYNFSVHDEEAPSTAFFRGKDDGLEAEVVSNISKLATTFVWDSFVSNMQSGTKLEMKKDNQDLTRWQSNIRLKTRRLSTFQTLSTGSSINTNHRKLPSLKEINKPSFCLDINETNAENSPVPPLSHLIEQWENVRKRYEDSTTTSRGTNRKGAEGSEGHTPGEII